MNTHLGHHIPARTHAHTHTHTQMHQNRHTPDRQTHSLSLILLLQSLPISLCPFTSFHFTTLFHPQSFLSSFASSLSVIFSSLCSVLFGLSLPLLPVRPPFPFHQIWSTEQDDSLKKRSNQVVKKTRKQENGPVGERRKEKGKEAEEQEEETRKRDPAKVGTERWIRG